MADVTESRLEASLGRRCFLRLGAGAAVAAAGMTAVEAQAGLGLSIAGATGVRSVTLHNINTGDNLRLDYWANGRYIPDALGAASRVLRDHHDGSHHRIDPRLLDILYALRKLTGAGTPFQVICGYRSPRTNASMRRSRRGVSSHSLHMLGKAVDIRLPGVGLDHLHRAALRLHGGGVGYYPSSNFVHVDSGPVRTWGGRNHYAHFDENEDTPWQEVLLPEAPGLMDTNPGLPQVDPATVHPRSYARLGTSPSPRAEFSHLPQHKPRPRTLLASANDEGAGFELSRFLVRRKPIPPGRP